MDRAEYRRRIEIVRNHAETRDWVCQCDCCVWHRGDSDEGPSFLSTVEMARAIRNLSDEDLCHMVCHGITLAKLRLREQDSPTARHVISLTHRHLWDCDAPARIGG